MLVLAGIVTAISPSFEYELPLLNKPVLLFTSIMLIAGAIYLFVIRFLNKASNSKHLLIWIILIGSGMRILMMFSTPILEDDYFRYLWDGAVTASGHNPYIHSPRAAVDEGSSVPTEIRQLAEESGDIIRRVNHPHIRTIYPPVAQGFFALSHTISPWSMTGWRMILLLMDALNLLLLFYLLRRLKLPSALVGVYWLNPLLVKEIFNSGHMDIIAIPFVLSAFLLLLRNKPMLSSGILALGIGVKLWPALLFPFWLKRIYPDYKKMTLVSAIFAVVSLAIFAPVFLSNINDTSGFITYSRSWENNDSLFMLFLGGWQLILPVFGIHPGHGQLAARITAIALLLLLIFLLTLRRGNGAADLLNRSLIVVAAAFLISPTQFPWYYVWLIPFLTFNPRLSLSVLTALLSLYYLRYYLEPRGMISLFSYGVVWIEFAPVWFLIIRDWCKARKENPILSETVLIES